MTRRVGKENVSRLGNGQRVARGETRDAKVVTPRPSRDGAFVRFFSEKKKKKKNSRTSIPMRYDDAFHLTNNLLHAKGARERERARPALRRSRSDGTMCGRPSTTFVMTDRRNATVDARRRDEATRSDATP